MSKNWDAYAEALFKLPYCPRHTRFVEECNDGPNSCHEMRNRNTPIVEDKKDKE